MSAYCQFRIQLFEALFFFLYAVCTGGISVGRWQEWVGETLGETLGSTSDRSLPASHSKVICEGQKVSSLWRHLVSPSRLSLSFPLPTKGL